MDGNGVFKLFTKQLFFQIVSIFKYLSNVEIVLQTWVR